ncbi:MAG: hypothetical protein ACK5MZ_09700 [Aestuariibaculum sp.]
MMIKKFISYLMIASVVFAIAIVNTSCSSDDDEPKEKTAEEIKAENIAEFATIIGNGVTNKKYEFAISLDDPITITDQAFNELTFMSSEDNNERFFKFDGEEFVFYDSYMELQGSVFDIEKGDNTFTFTVKRNDQKKAFFGGQPVTDGEFVFKVTYDTTADIITTFWGGYETDKNYNGTSIVRYKAEPYISSKKISEKTTKNYSLKNSSTASFTGIHAVYVKLEPAHWTANLPAFLLQPEGNHHVKFTSLANGKTRVQFCDASGNVSGNSVPTDYYHSTTKHFWKNQMPMALNLEDVNFTYNSTTGSISPGTNVMARARPNDNPKGVVPPFFGGILTNQNSGSNATIISSSGNTASNFRVEIKLDFQVNFHCVITK